MFHAVVFALSVYVLSRLLPSFSLGIGWKWLIALILLATWQYHLFLRLFPGSLASPEIPRTILVILSWTFGALILLLMFFLLRDVVALLLWLARLIGSPLAPGLFTPAWSGGLAIAAALLSGVGVWQALKVPEVRSFDVSLKGLPPEMDGLTLVQLTDLHISRLFPEAWARAVVDRTNALAPDMILITGDLIDGTVDARKDDVEPLRDLHAPLGVLTITGNHEYYSGYGAWMDKYRELGLKLLSNDHVAVTRNGGTLYVAGITDAAAAGFADPLPDIHQALDGIPQGAPVILMAHRPGDAAAAADLGVGLQLSGHTHGGQIVGFHLLAKAANRGFVSGSYQVGKMMLYVSNGTGLWGGFPIRLGFPSEITYITLRAIGAAPHTS